MRTRFILKYFYVLLLLMTSEFSFCQDEWITFHPPVELANGKHIVLISGDESYRSEEALPMLAKILTYHHGFHTTVLFSINPATGFIDPNYHHNIPGLHLLDSADLLIISTRFRELPDEQMEHIDSYLKLGKPVIGLRTATHAFRFSKDSDSKYRKYDYKCNEEWKGGFGKQILGETWISHHGLVTEGTVSLKDGIADLDHHPILNGVGIIYGPSGVYSTEKFDDRKEILLWGASTRSLFNDSLPILEKSIMPIAWVGTYEIQESNPGKVFTTTLGASVDFEDEDLRKLVVNAAFWLLGYETEIPEDGCTVRLIGDYNPTMFGFDGFKNGLKPKDYMKKN